MTPKILTRPTSRQSSYSSPSGQATSGSFRSPEHERRSHLTHASSSSLTSSQPSPKHPPSQGRSRASSLSAPHERRSRLTHGSTTSLISQSSPKHAPSQGRSRISSFSQLIKRPNGSRQQISTVQDIERRSPPAPTPRQILFYDRHRPYYGFTNFSPHSVEYKGKAYPTSEHLFQSFKVNMFI
jgi:hypothetical protein